MCVSVGVKCNLIPVELRWSYSCRVDIAVGLSQDLKLWHKTDFLQPGNVIPHRAISGLSWLAAHSGRKSFCSKEIQPHTPGCLCCAFSYPACVPNFRLGYKRKSELSWKCWCLMCTQAGCLYNLFIYNKYIWWDRIYLFHDFICRFQSSWIKVNIFMYCNTLSNISSQSDCTDSRTDILCRAIDAPGQGQQ